MSQSTAQRFDQSSPPPPAEPILIPKKQIFAFAEMAGEKLGFNPGDPIEPIVEALGGKIEYLDLDDIIKDACGSIDVRGEKDFTIHVSSFSGPLRNRFTIAHELGHYFLHAKAGKIAIRVHRNTSESDRVEWEANWFAAGFLMPATHFREVAKPNPQDFELISAIFQVSTQAARIRAKDLGLI